MSIPSSPTPVWDLPVLWSMPEATERTVWTGSQKSHKTREGVAKILELPVENVHGIWVPGPGSYGRNDAGDAAMDAALLSQAIGRPAPGPGYAP